MLLLVLLLASQVDFVVGTFLPPSELQRAKGFAGYDLAILEENLTPSYSNDGGTQQSFFTVFAVFFPAVTGIVAGANLSGDLRSPGTAIPKGTLLAIATTYVSYVAYAVLIACTTHRHVSLANIRGKKYFLRYFISWYAITSLEESNGNLKGTVHLIINIRIHNAILNRNTN